MVRGRRRVLVIEDDPEMAEQLVEAIDQTVQRVFSESGVVFRPKHLE
jgi:hypothetical protein